jgi:ketosteroid isomerase-like protein
MKKRNAACLLFLTFALIAMNACNSGKVSDDLSKSKQDILNTEKAFAACVKHEGMTEAFTKFAAEDAAINRGNLLLKGKQAIKEYYAKEKADKDSLSWSADYVDISASGDLGYTYGNYLYTVIDSTGQKKEYKGIFHTVWKKQVDGSWKYVWD